MADLIPTGSWSLWYHSPNESKWTTSTYKLVVSIKTWSELWALVDAISEESFLNGFFFFMKDPAPPLWENKANIRGGSYSMRISHKDAFDIYIKYVVGSMLGVVSSDEANILNGVTISPKRGFNVINVWNEDYEKASKSIKLLTKVVEPSEIRYTRNVDKKFN